MAEQLRKISPAWTLVSKKTGISCGDLFLTKELAEDNCQSWQCVVELTGEYTPIHETIKVEGWVNAYPPGIGGCYPIMHPTKDEALRKAHSNAIACVHVTGEAPATVKEKVKHRAEVGNIARGMVNFIHPAPDGSKLFAEWED